MRSGASSSTAHEARRSSPSSSACRSALRPLGSSATRLCSSWQTAARCPSHHRSGRSLSGEPQRVIGRESVSVVA
ncbi:hypothetical protein ACFPRL_15130 [Pseudoclavibacter helvolus]